MCTETATAAQDGIVFSELAFSLLSAPALVAQVILFRFVLRLQNCYAYPSDKSLTNIDKLSDKTLDSQLFEFESRKF